MGHDGDEDLIDVVVEIPKGTRNKYEFDHHAGVFRLDRRLLSATTYPADYGFIPDTLGEDGDPLDALVLLDDPTFPGCWVKVRPLGVFWMEDEKGPDAKIIGVLRNDAFWDPIADIESLPAALRAEIEHFFDVYKMLEKKKTATKGFAGREAALEEIAAARRRYTDGA